jgi:inosose dehydratase
VKAQPNGIGRRSSLGGLAVISGAVSPVLEQPKRRLRPGHTAITWGFQPDDASVAIPEIGSLGYEGYETFGEYLVAWELKGGLKAVLDNARLPLISAYCNVNLTDPTKSASRVSKIVRWAKLIQKCGGVTAVIGPNGVRRSSSNFRAGKQDIVAALNEISRAVSDVGIVAALHQHTGACIESRDKVYAVLDLVKVWNGGRHWVEYCPLGQGKVHLPAVLELLERSQDMKVIIVELDPSARARLTPIETARVSKEYLQKQGNTFRS